MAITAVGLILLQPMKKWKERSVTERGMLVLLILLVLAIFSRWEFIKKEIGQTVKGYFPSDTTIVYTPK
jgi:Mn2+/Fe2+ NRAMP family transporter